MDFLAEKLLAIFMALVCPFLTIFDMPGNSLLLVTSLGFAFLNSEAYYSKHFVMVVLLVYLLGELWEFTVSFFGIKRKDVSWFAALLIGIGGFMGTAWGTLVLPVFGSIIGGVVGAAATAFAYELLRGGAQEHAVKLAWRAAKVRFLAMIGKLAAGITLAIFLIKQVVF
jgi:hypothetical protein